MDPLHELHLKARALEMFAEANEDVVGYYMSGSYAMKAAQPGSDLDPVFIVRDGRERDVWLELEKTGIDLAACTVTLMEHKRFLEFDGAQSCGKSLSRYDFVHVKVLIDRAGDIKDFVERQACLSEEEKDLRGKFHLNCYINSFYRSLKASRESWQLAPHMEAASSVLHAVEFLFASERRVAPYPKYLEWELNNYPLDFLLSGDYLLRLIGGIINNIDVKAQVKLFDAICVKARHYGFGATVDSWAGKPERLAMSFRA